MAAVAPSATARPAGMDLVAVHVALDPAARVPAARAAMGPAVRAVMVLAVVPATAMTVATNRAGRLPSRCRTST